ncbi:hypothetical protein NQ318_010378 [Aromia moschata]|uniref:C2H2-type domain-containing protein n=1 Tax=Aromia moschata TaxID=1265417 RepID=A0AAV8XXT4_9CUCU|nr:hypothetical protein NQ318_010378 [Aromia moschata]
MNNFNPRLTNCCRTCLRLETAGTSLNALDSDNVWLREGVSDVLCTGCLCTLRVAYDFRLQCLQSENEIQRYFNQNLNNFVSNSAQIQIAHNGQKPYSQQQNSDCLNLKQILDEAELLKCPSREDHRVDAPDLIMTAGLEKYEKAPRRLISTRSIKTQTQPLPQYPTLTPAAARLEAQQNKTTIIVEDPYKFSQLFRRGIASIAYGCVRIFVINKNDFGGKFNNRAILGEKPFGCTYCDKKFTSGYILNSHLKTHTGDRPWQCSYCGKTFTQSSHLTVHMKKHTGEKFVCKFCSQEFAHSSQLTVHVRLHTGKQPYKCAICDKVCNYASELQTHMMRHTGGEVPVPHLRQEVHDVRVSTGTHADAHRGEPVQLYAVRQDVHEVHLPGETREDAYGRKTICLCDM